MGNLPIKTQLVIAFVLLFLIYRFLLTFLKPLGVDLPILAWIIYLFYRLEFPEDPSEDD